MKPIVIVSGWAMSAEVMMPLAEALRGSGAEVSVISLADAEGQDWHSLLTTLAQQVNGKPVLLVGWSLGGNLCMRFAAHYPELVAGVVTIASTPCFVQQPDWPQAMPERQYQEFALSVANNIPATLKSFPALCASGSADQKATTRLLRAQVPWALARANIWPALLDRLVEDARSEWQQVQCPAIHLLADSDPLSRSTIAENLQQLLPSHRVQTVTGGHAIFIEHQQLVVESIFSLEDYP